VGFWSLAEQVLALMGTDPLRRTGGMVVELGLDGTVDSAGLEAGIVLAETYSSRHRECYNGERATVRNLHEKAGASLPRRALIRPISL